MQDFEFLEHTSDIYVRSHGKNLKQALVNCGKGLTAILVRNPDAVRKLKDRSVEIKAKDLEELVYLWLEELIFLFDSEAFLFRGFSGELKAADSGYLMTGTVKGEKYDPSRHRPGVHVKGVTYHNLDVRTGRNETTITVLLDI